MALNTIRYRAAGAVRWGVVRGDAIAAIEGEYPSTRDFVLEGAARARAAADADPLLKLADVEVLCPVTPDRKFLCQAVNYHSHMRDSGMDAESSPFNIFFRKAESCLAAADTDIVRPAHVHALDYEVELGLVLARDVDGPLEVTEASLHELVAGLVLVNDVSARDVQLPEMQFYKGKSYRTFGPVGPFLTLVDAADLARFDELRLTLSVNGEVRQDSLTTDMVHRPAATLTELSGLQDLEAGDLLATGTPGGCALQAPAKPAMMVAQLMSPRRRQGLIRRMAGRNPAFLKPGDVVEARIRTDDGAIDLGRQRNKVTSG